MIFVPNETERNIDRYANHTMDEIREAACSLLQKGFKNVIVTLGKKGHYG